MADKWIQLMSEDGTDNLFPTTHMDLLWTNASPSSTFGAQNITYDNNPYSWFVVMFCEKNTATGVIGFALVQKGVHTALCLTSDIHYRRMLKFTNAFFGFESGTRCTSYGSPMSQNNGDIIPLKIYGIK